MGDYVLSGFEMTIRAACRVLSISRTVYYYKPDTTKDDPVIAKLQELAEKNPRWGFGKMYPLYIGK